MGGRGASSGIKRRNTALANWMKKARLAGNRVTSARGG